MMRPKGFDIYVATGPVDLRWSFDLLAGVVNERIRQEPRAGSVFLYFNGRRTRAKALFFDKTGYCILYKRLDRGTFRLPVVIEPWCNPGRDLGSGVRIDSAWSGMWDEHQTEE